VHTAFVIETTEYLYKGGRCSALQNIVVSFAPHPPHHRLEPDGTMVCGQDSRLTQKGPRLSAGDLEQHRAVWTRRGCS
jgi:fatty acid-binding protein DegV